MSEAQFGANSSPDIGLADARPAEEVEGVYVKKKFLTAVLTIFAGATMARATQTFNGFPNPDSITFDGKNVWVISQLSGPQNTGVVYKLNQTGNLLATIPLTAPSFLTQSASDGTNLWVAGAYNSGNGTVTKIGPDGTILDAVSVGQLPFGVLYDGKGHIFVANETGQSVTEIDATTDAVIATIPIAGHEPYAMTMDPAGNLWVVCVGRNVYVINPVTQAITNTYTYSYNFLETNDSIVYAAGYMWIADQYDNYVIQVDPATGAALDAITVGKKPSSLAFDGTNLWVADFGGNNVVKINPTTVTAIGKVAVGSEPMGLAVAGAFVWVANNTGGSVTRFSTSQ